jgi:hypothetical protein
MDYRARLTELGLEPWKPHQGVIDEIEERIGVPLPAEYRRFLGECGGWWGDIFCPCQEATPFGEEHGIAGFQDSAEVRDLLDSMITPRNMITIATGHFAKYTCLSIAGVDRGCVYALDGESRAWWDDEEFHLRFNAMDDSIREYLRLRADDELPPKPTGYDHLYRLASSFDEFLESCRDED